MGVGFLNPKERCPEREVPALWQPSTTLKGPATLPTPQKACPASRQAPFTPLEGSESSPQAFRSGWRFPAEGLESTVRTHLSLPGFPGD